MTKRQRVIVRLTQQQLRCEKLGECIWPGEKLTVEEIRRRLRWSYLLWAESERGLAETRAA